LFVMTFKSLEEWGLCSLSFGSRKFVDCNDYNINLVSWMYQSFFRFFFEKSK
jgi:hypothetical protein